MEVGRLLGQSTNSLGEKGRHRVRAERAHPAPGCETSAAELLAAARFGIPEPTASYVHRPRLLDSLARRESLPLVLVSGPAGSGKTSTVADWVRRRRSRTAATGWIAFEDGDAFWANVLECLRRLGLEVPAGPGGAAPDAAQGREQHLARVTHIADQPRRGPHGLDGNELTFDNGGSMRRLLKRLLTDRSGATALEYGLMSKYTSFVAVEEVAPDQVQQTGCPGLTVTVPGRKAVPRPLIVILASTPAQPADGLGSPPPGPSS